MMYKKLSHSLLALAIFLAASTQSYAQTQFIKYKKYLIPIQTSGFNTCPAGSKPRVIIDTDIAGLGLADDDDIQSLIHYLVSSYRFETVGIISAPGKPGTGQVSDIQTIINLYNNDYNELSQADPNKIYQSSFVLKQGLYERPAIVPPYTGLGDQEGAKFIKDEAEKILAGQECGPLYIFEWGPIANVALALKGNPDIAPVLRVISSAGSGNKPPGQPSPFYDYINNNFTDLDKLWLIESNVTHTGMGYRSPLALQKSVKAALDNYGCLGQRLALTKTDHPETGAIKNIDSLKAGDSPSFLYLISNNNVNDPTSGSLGGEFRQDAAGLSSKYWRDLAPPLDPSSTVGPHGDINQPGTIYGEWYQDMQNAGLGCD